MKFSIITVTKNNSQGLIRAIECVRNQTYKNIEHIIVDGGSTDGTADILNHFQKDKNDTVIPANELSQEVMSDSGLRRNNIKIFSPITNTNHYSLLTLSEADKGIYDAINKGIKLASGEVIGLLHSDDLFSNENVIQKYADIFERHFDSLPTSRHDAQGDNANIDAVYSDLVYVKKKLEVRSEKLEQSGAKTTEYNQLTTNYSIIRNWKTHRSATSNLADHYSPITDNLLRNGWMPPHPTLFIRREIFDKYGLYNTSFKIASDYEMILRLFWKYKITTHYLPITTYLMTIGGASNKNFKNILQKSKEDLSALKLHNIPHPVITLLMKNIRKLPQFLAYS